MATARERRVFSPKSTSKEQTMSSLQQTATACAIPASFVDMHQFARDKSKGIPMPASPGDDRFLASRRVLDWAQGPVTAGVIELDSDSGSVQSLPADEFIIVHR